MATLVAPLYLLSCNCGTSITTTPRSAEWDEFLALHESSEHLAQHGLAF